MSKEIIVGFDGSESARDALALGFVLAEAASGGLVVANVYLHDRYHDTHESENPGKAEADEVLEQATKLLAGRPAETIAVPASTTSRGLYELAAERGAAVVVVGSTERSAIGRVVPGSTARHLLTGAPCAVAVAPRGFSDRDDPIATIGVAFDGSDESRNALSVAAELASAVDGRIGLFRALPVPLTSLAAPSPTASGAKTHLDELRDEAEQECADALADVPVPHRDGVEVKIGAPTKVLVQRSENLDLLVCGSRGYGRGHQVLLGSTSGHLVDHAHCAVLVMPRGAGDGVTG